jgi:glycosyltransferase involved in cell wall biosynthesis
MTILDNGGAYGMKKVLIIIPAYNEASNIEKVIHSLKSEDSCWDIVVVNDGSHDSTGKAAEATGKAFVINLPCNLGIGGAVQTGFMFARLYGYDTVLQFDGDGQHKASEIPKLLQPIIDDQCDIVIGSRFCVKHQGWKSTFARRIGIKIFELVNSLLIGQKITDNTSGFRAYNRKSINFLADNYPTDYPEPEAVVLLGKNHFRIKEVWVEMQERQGGVSSISGLKPIYYIVKVMLAVLFSALRPRVVDKEIQC